jgi:hypothetical protein
MSSGMRLRRISDAVGILQDVSALDPGMPILDSLRRLLVNVHSHQLNQWDCESPPTLPGNSHEHFVLADLVRWHATHVNYLANSQRRCNTLSNTAGLEWKTQVFFEVVVPADCLFFRLRINDDLPHEALFEIVVAASARHIVAARQCGAHQPHPQHLRPTVRRLDGGSHGKWARAEILPVGGHEAPRWRP